MEYPNIDASNKFLQFLSRDVDFITSKSGQHSFRVMRWMNAMGNRFGLAEPDIALLQMGALFHDIGKIGVPRDILLKEDPLTEQEWILIRLHPTIGSSILRATYTHSNIAELVYLHQEKYNGGGYPVGLAGSDIPLLARIIAVVDAFDAMTDDRPYRKACHPKAALSELQRMSGKQFDPLVVNIFSELVNSERGMIC